MKNLTICIPTHTIKIEAEGPYTGMHQKIPSAPSSKLISVVLEDLFQKTNLEKTTKIHIGLDKRKFRELDTEYQDNLNKLSDIYPNLKVIVNESDIADPIQTAPRNFVKLIDSVKTKYYLFWEHDWIFTKQINIKNILDELDENNKINWIRFSQFVNNNSQFKHLYKDKNRFIPEEYTDKNPSKNIPLLPTISWSNNPYICRTEVFQKWWKTFIYPTYESGGFVEGPLNVFFEFYMEKQGIEHAMNTFKCFVYGNLNDAPMVTHLNGYRV